MVLSSRMMWSSLNVNVVLDSVIRVGRETAAVLDDSEDEDIVM